MMRKKGAALIMVLMLCLVLGACQEKADEKGTDTRTGNEAGNEAANETGNEADDSYAAEFFDGSLYTFTGTEKVKYTMTAPQDGEYFILVPVQNYEGTEEKHVKLSSPDLEFLNDVTITAQPGIAGRIWKIVELTAGDYTIIAEGLDEGPYNITVGFEPAVELESLSGRSYTKGEWTAYYCTYDEPASADFLYEAEGGCSIAFFSSSDTAWMHVEMLGQDETEKEFTVDFPAGQGVIYFYGDTTKTETLTGK